MARAAGLAARRTAGAGVADLSGLHEPEQRPARRSLGSYSRWAIIRLGAYSAGRLFRGTVIRLALAPPAATGPTPEPSRRRTG